PLLDGRIERIHVDMNYLALPSGPGHAPFVARGDRRRRSLDLRHRDRGREAPLVLPLDSGARDKRSNGALGPLACPRPSRIRLLSTLPHGCPRVYGRPLARSSDGVRTCMSVRGAAGSETRAHGSRSLHRPDCPLKRGALVPGGVESPAPSKLKPCLAFG